jgi:2-oxoglutarate ferredoxin oxidoreductase subunit beta
MPATKKTFKALDHLLRKEQLPSCWCPGCGIGTMVNVFVHALEKVNRFSPDVYIFTTDVGCTGKIDQYVDMPFYKIKAGLNVDPVIRRKIGNTARKVAFFIDDTDFLVSGIEVFKQAVVEGTDLFIIYLNTFIYRLFMEQRALSRRLPREGDTDGCTHSPLNIPHLAKHCGARFIARWTPHYPRRLMDSMIHALERPGLSVVEVISPCLLYFPSIGMMGETIDRICLLKNETVIGHHESIEDLNLKHGKKIVLGNFELSEN